MIGSVRVSVSEQRWPGNGQLRLISFPLTGP